MALHERFFRKRPDVTADRKPKSGWTRRDVLKGITALGAAAAIGVEGQRLASTAEAKEPLADDSATTEASDEAEPGDFDRFNRETALPVTATFLGFVGNAAFNGGSFDWKSMVTLNSFEFARLAKLKSQGGERGAHVADEEMHENAVAAGLGLALVAIADFTSSSIRVNESSVFENVKTRVLEAFGETEDSTRPALEADSHVWAEYLTALNQRIAKKAAEMQALTSTLAPFFTTYTSSAVADQLQEGMAHLVFEQSYATAVITQQQSAAEGTPLDDTALQAAAAQRANELLSGPWGLTNLETTFAANIHGAVLGGDPPQLFGMVKHWGNWERLAKAEAFGAANSVYMTTVATGEWLRRVGVTGAFDDDSYRDALGEAHAKAAQVFGDIHFGSIAPESQTQLEDRLREAGVLHSEDVVAAQAKMTLSVGDYARERAVMARQLPSQTKEQIERTIRSFGAGLETAASTAQEYIGQLQAFLLDSKKLPTAELVPDGISDDKVYPIDEVTTATQAAKRQVPAGDKQSGPLVDFSGVTQKLAAAKQLQEEASQKPKSEDHAGHHPSPAQEVFYTLGSQISAVGPTTVLAEQSINTLFHLKGQTEGQVRSNKSDVLKAMTAALTSETVLSSLADNIAAYVYAEKLMGKIVKKVYGEDVLEKHPRLGDAIYAISLKLAEAAGALTKFGNGPNFLMKRREFVQNAVTGSWEMQKIDVPFELYSNRYAVAANTFLIGESLAWLSYELSLVEQAA